MEIARTTSPDSSFYGAQGYENLAATLTDLFQVNILVSTELKGV